MEITSSVAFEASAFFLIEIFVGNIDAFKLRAPVARTDHFNGSSNTNIWKQNVIRLLRQDYDLHCVHKHPHKEVLVLSALPTTVNFCFIGVEDVFVL